MDQHVVADLKVVEHANIDAATDAADLDFGDAILVVDDLDDLAGYCEST